MVEQLKSNQIVMTHKFAVTVVGQKMRSIIWTMIIRSQFDIVKAVLYNFDLLMMSTIVLETCRGI